MEYFFSSQTISLISLALLVVGFSKFILYYKAFNVPIVDYIDPSEIITLFADSIATASMIVLILAVPYISLIMPYNLSGVDVGIGFTSRLAKHTDLLLPLMIIGFVFLVIALAILWKRPKIKKFELTRFVWLWPIITVVVPMLVLETGAYTTMQPFQQHVMAIALIVSFACLVFVGTWNEIEKVKAGYFNKVVVELESGAITSSPTEFYIGKTKSYVFFYSTVDKASTAHSSSKLKSIKFIPQ
jgi:hypothetical protein